MYDYHRRVLVTGFGPFGTFKENPSWLAVKTLHDTILNPKQKSIHVTSLNIPTVYSAVLDTVPGLHSAPPVLPEKYTSPISLPLPDEGFDLIIHVGVAGPGNLHVERLAHKTGYALPDYDKQPPPLVNTKGTLRGFGGPRYGAEFADEIFTSIDVDKLVRELTTGPKPVSVQTSDDAGRYLCDFIYYCSLAESQREGRGCPVLFVHCPPVGNMLSTEEVAEGLKRIIIASL
ncbi:Proteophosphoglycan ppg4 [Mycena indigotica]|uniref:Proteophosphoglycan ppg4 n=1 Tax=Mycena indigotica TaxID=2126181 RepID=A0A8H6WHS1_9AGAR|nr:Proteophosphoglycan ppg4 [Mycena indigotica]KAF7315378.1 Proteophosphoglycan ppg4 [Mycena indigotica]